MLILELLSQKTADGTNSQVVYHWRRRWHNEKASVSSHNFYAQNSHKNRCMEPQLLHLLLLQYHHVWLVFLLQNHKHCLNDESQHLECFKGGRQTSKYVSCSFRCLNFVLIIYRFKNKWRDFWRTCLSDQAKKTLKRTLNFLDCSSRGSFQGVSTLSLWGTLVSLVSNFVFIWCKNRTLPLQIELCVPYFLYIHTYCFSGLKNIFL